MTTLREVAHQALEWANNHGEIVFAGGGWKAVDGMNAWTQALRAALEQHDKDVQWLKERQEHWSRQKSLWERAMHSQCAQGCEFLAMEQRRNEREATLKERGFE